MWFLFTLLSVYVYASAKSIKLNNYISTIRKTWYLVFLLGCSFFLTNDLGSLVNHWKEYLIVLVVFIVIDSLLFLELHVSKFGGQELKSSKIQIGQTQKQLDDFTKKSRHIPEILTSFDFPVYTRTKVGYIKKLNDLISEYGIRENLLVRLYPYQNPKEKEYLLEILGKLKEKARRHLEQLVIFFSPKDNIALLPIVILDYQYVVYIETYEEKEKILEIDGEAIMTLIIAYNLTVKTTNNDEGGEEHGNSNKTSE